MWIFGGGGENILYVYGETILDFFLCVREYAKEDIS